MNKNFTRSLYFLLFAVIVLIMATSPSLAAEPAKKVTLNLQQTTVLGALEHLTKVKGFKIIYNHEKVDSKERFDLVVKEKTLDEVLTICLARTNMTFKVVDNVYVLTPRADKQAKGSSKINGVVSDIKGVGVAGATISVESTTVGTITDGEGKFNLNIPNVKNPVLIISFIGLETKKIPFEGQTQLNVVLNEMAEKLDEVVVTGYANINKNSFTGNYTSVTADQIKMVSSKNVMSALQVFDPSLRITENLAYGSDPNALPEFSIRGNSSMGVNSLDAATSLSKSNIHNNTNLPIFILDGFEVSVEKVYDMDMNRIQNITILKDAGATAMYGSRAANGVVVITSVSPKTGKINVSYNFVGTLMTPDLSDYNLMNAREKLYAEKLAGVYTGSDANESSNLRDIYDSKKKLVDAGVDTYWLAFPLANIFNHKHTIYIEGGEGGFKFGAGLRYNKNSGVMKKSLRDTYGGNLVLDYRYKNLQIRNDVSYDIMKSQESPYGVFSDYALKQPYDRYCDENGNYLRKTNEFLNNDKNPLYDSQLAGYDRSDYNEIRNNFGINYIFKNDLTFRGQLSFSKKFSTGKRFVDPDDSNYSENTSAEYRGELFTKAGASFDWSTNLLLMYNKKIANHYVNLTMGLNAVDGKTDNLSAEYRGIAMGSMDDIAFAKTIVRKPTHNYSESRLIGALSSLNYTYNNIYLFDASFRLDGSSLFGTDKKTAPFWSMGTGLNISNYKFFKNDLVSELRVRGSYGSLGKVNFPSYAAVTTYRYDIENSYSTGNAAYLLAMGNPNLTWETTRTLDFGFDMKMCKSLLEIKASYYRKKTVDLITNVDLPATSGFRSYTDNLGGIINEGYEIYVRGTAYQRKDASLILYANLNHNKNKITAISNSLKKLNKEIDQYMSKYPTQTDPNPYNKPLTKYEEGGSTTSIYAMRSAGIDPTNGKEKYIKRDGTSTYTWSAADQVIVGNKLPDFQGSFGCNARYKSLSMYISFMYEYGAQAYNQVLVNSVENANIMYNNVDKRVLYDRWINIGDLSPLKNIKDRNEVTKPTSRFVQNKNVLSCQSISLRYDMKSSLVKKLGFSQMNVQLSTENPFRWSTVKEERGTSYPFARTYNISLNVTM